MTITTLSAHKGNTWKIELDDSGELFFLHVSVVQRCGLRKGMTLTPQQWEQVQTAELSRKAYQYACFLLDNRGYSYQAGASLRCRKAVRDAPGVSGDAPPGTAGRAYHRGAGTV